MRAAALAAAAVAAAGALALDGAQAFGRLGLRLGLPTPALTADPALEGLALHGLGRYAEAAEAFRVAGPTESYNRADALARAGDYGNALAAYAAVLARDPADWRARENRDVVRALWDAPRGAILPGTEAAGDGTGPEDALSPFDEAVAADGGAPKLAEQPRSALAPTVALGRQEVLRMPDAAAQVASDRWLATFPDDPGLWLAAAIAAEHARRAAAGLAPPPPEDPR